MFGWLYFGAGQVAIKISDDFAHGLVAVFGLFAEHAGEDVLQVCREIVDDSGGGFWLVIADGFGEFEEVDAEEGFHAGEEFVGDDAE